ncbi:MAG: protein phosphatase 2C domain-containing protein [Gemmataceae bacterium]|nr:protein phosphatase 2C domain-containing protein [Gemmataceae bacterium]
MSGLDLIDYASLSDVGVRRSHNQDSHATLPANDAEQWQTRGHVFLVADGMGAHAVGELASKLAADTIPHIYSKYAHDGPVPALRKAFVETNLTIHNRGQQNREFAGMGTTGTALVLRPEGAWVGHVGDSRCYRVRDGRIEQLSFDHSLLWELARRQKKQPEELQGVPANVIVRSLGPEPLVQVDVEGPHSVEPGDCFVLCSDGLSGPVSDREIGTVASVLPPEEACQFLIHLANLQGGPDNITAIVVQVNERTAPAPTPSNPDVQLPDAGAAFAPKKAKSLGDYVRRIPWPLASLFLGIVLAVAAIYLTAFEVKGEVFTFIVAAIALLAGLAGLMVQNLRENREPLPEDYSNTEPRIHRETSCTIDVAVVQRLVQATATLEERIRENQWDAACETSKGHSENARRLQKQGDLPGAFREQCRGMLLLMEAVNRQKNKEETFLPLWDRPISPGQM